MMWKLRSPNDLDARTSRGGAHKLQLDRGFFFYSAVFVPGDEELGFAKEECFMEKIVVNNFVCPAVCTEI